MVLFLFVIMLLDLREEQRRRLKLFGLASAFVCVGTLVFIMVGAITDTRPGTGLAEPELAGATKSLGAMLFTDYLLPFEIVSLLLLVAMVGVVLLSKKDLK
jgi:NADH-quinone oxidoreductase subunit J